MNKMSELMDLHLERRMGRTVTIAEVKAAGQPAAEEYPWNNEVKQRYGLHKAVDDEGKPTWSNAIPEEPAFNENEVRTLEYLKQVREQEAADKAFEELTRQTRQEIIREQSFRRITRPEPEVTFKNKHQNALI